MVCICHGGKGCEIVEKVGVGAEKGGNGPEKGGVGPEKRGIDPENGGLGPEKGGLGAVNGAGKAGPVNKERRDGGVRKF